MAQFTNEATIYGIDYAFIIATGITAVAFVLSFFIRKVKINREGQGKEVDVKPAKA
ncbi:hypothetical protein D3C73_1296820 [compost metagenome]